MYYATFQEGGNQRPQRQNMLPLKSRGRGMPSRRIQTPTEERRYVSN